MASEFRFSDMVTLESFEKNMSETEVEKVEEKRNDFFSKTSFASLPICDSLKQGLSEKNFEFLTEIQHKAIPPLLAGKDVLGRAKTGSGKTLAFLVPCLDVLITAKFQARNGMGAVVISPTRELAGQIYDVLRDLAKHISQTHALVIGGTSRKTEADKLMRGVNVVIATPGRLLDHLMNTRGFVYSNLVYLVIDEADRILEIGFEEEINQILKLLAHRKRTCLFSATLPKKVENLARLSLTDYVVVKAENNNGGEQEDGVATVAGLRQGYIVCPAEDRFRLLFTFLKKNRTKKVMVFFSSCNSVKFHDELLNYIDLEVMSIHGQKKQSARMTTFYRFCQADTGILLCTDVAARGLDIPKVDWIVQFDPTDDPREYIHRVGRTARGAGGQGDALLFLLPEELGFLRYLRKSGVPLSEYDVPATRIANIQGQLEKLIETNFHLHRGSRDAYRSYLHAYAAHATKDVFDVTSLDLARLAKSFGFGAPPKVELHLKNASNSQREKKRQVNSKNGFSTESPYGKRTRMGDGRQFSK